MKRPLLLLCVLSAGFAPLARPQKQPLRWTEQQANDWYRNQPWLVGANYIPSTAINELEMWQADTFDPQRIDLELGWAESIGMNTMRVFLHDLLWKQDAAGFRQRIDTFLTIAARHHIRPMFVLFDSCWNPNPRLGKQPSPKPGVHNSGWVQSPGSKALAHRSAWPRLGAYVRGVVGAFGKDPRVLAWDLWNEPSNKNDSSSAKAERRDKVQTVIVLLPKVFAWARQVQPDQPLTSGVWEGDWSAPEKLSAMARVQIENSDIISFHNYGPPAEFEKSVQWLLPYNRPVICTEYMARGNGSTFQGSLPVAKKY
ncbi:MAG: cellulase family glycosylhydrolase, partial [Bryobacteraceae bacterium]